MAESDVGAVDVGDRTVSSGKVSLAALTALGIGSMIGGGIFGLPQQMARAAAPGPLIIGWLITGVGMLMLAFVYQRLAVSRPEINAGVYGYARAGFGDLAAHGVSRADASCHDGDGKPEAPMNRSVIIAAILFERQSPQDGEKDAERHSKRQHLLHRRHKLLQEHL